MYTRLIERPRGSFFLFGPRGTGKTTWLRAELPDALRFDLLESDLFFHLLRDPAELRRRVEASPPGWVVIDEVQKLPALLDEVHLLLERKKHRFVLTGSSARKLKRGGANLLAGRAVNRAIFPLTLRELGTAPTASPVDALLRWGGLPALHAERAPDRERADFLEAYAGNYLREEIQQEAQVKSLEGFARFLSVAALANAQVVNVAGMARDSAVARATVQGYFDVLVDTLLGAWLPAWQKRPRLRQVQHPKFYFFDCGVARAVAGRAREPLEAAERGPLLETWVFHELRAHLSYAGVGGELSYWRTAAGVEIDFVWTKARRAVGIEVKATRRWRPEDGKALRRALDEGLLTAGYGVYLGEAPLMDGPVKVMPVGMFAGEVGEGRIVG